MRRFEGTDWGRESQEPRTSPIDSTNRSAKALQFGAWKGLKMTFTPALFRVSLNCLVNLESRCVSSKGWRVQQELVLPG